MIQTINPYATSRTAEIMSRYRPIAPKPETPAASAAEGENPGVPNGIRKSPYLRNMWAHLQARPTRTRKRARSAPFSPPSVKRARTCLQGLSPPYQLAAKSLTMHGLPPPPQISIAGSNLVPINCGGGLDTAVTTLAETLALPLLYSAPPLKNETKGIDLNMAAEQGAAEDLDLHLHLFKPIVISPRPVRPVGSNIIVKKIIVTDDATISKGPEQVEEAVEADAAPAIVSDSNNKVRMSNAAYKEMVGQPECCWLERCRGRGGKRIGGEVSLRFADAEVGPPLPAAAFTCAVRIEWECEGKKVFVDASCAAVKLACEGKDYQFLWRFLTAEEAEKSAVSDY